MQDLKNSKAIHEAALSIQFTLDFTDVLFWTASNTLRDPTEFSYGLRCAKRYLMSWVVVIPKEGRARVTPTFYIFFWQKFFFLFLNFFFFFFFFFFFLKSRCHTKRRAGAAPRARPSCGMTPTQAIRDLFARHHPYFHPTAVPSSEAVLRFLGWTRVNIVN